MKIKKFLLPLAFAGSAAIAAFTAACSPSKSDTQTPESPKTPEAPKEKTIILAVDGVQEKFYNKVIEEFNKSDSHKVDGFVIKTIKKDVWSAKDIGVAGTTDESVPDIFYAPELVDLVQANAVSDLNTFDPKLFDEIANIVGATDEEKKQMKAFGSLSGVVRATNKRETRLFGLRHNKEGIILASNKSLEETKKQLTSPDSDTLVELVENGEGFFRIQDLWYGNGVLAGAFEKIKNDLVAKAPEDQKETTKEKYSRLINKIVYTENTDGKPVVQSGFVEDNEFNPQYKQAVDTVVKLVYPFFKAAYIDSAEEFKTTIFHAKKISQGDIQALLDKDMGNVQNKIWELLKDKKISYAIIGSWDLQNTEKSADAQTFLNVINVDEGVPYLQAPGSWSYMINSRNNGAAPERKKAISTLLKAIFNKESYAAYFKDDSKIPFTAKMRSDVQAFVAAEQLAESKELNDQIKQELGYENIKELESAYNNYTKNNPLKSLSSFEIKKWSVENDNNPLDSKNLLSEEIAAISGIQKEEAKDIKNKLSTLKTTGLRNVVAALLGIQLNQLEGNGQVWQVGVEVLKDGAIQQLKEAQQSENSLHVRKVEKLIFDVNGDNAEEWNAVLNKYTQAIKSENPTEEVKKLVDDALAKAKDFVAKAAKNTVSEEVVKKAVEAYTNTFLLTAEIREFVNKFFLDESFPKKDGTPSTWEVKKVLFEINEFNKKLAINKLMDVINSSAPITDLTNNKALGELKTQTYRLDNSNPAFGSIAWVSWNDQTFGNKIKYEELAKSKQVTSEEEFKNKIVELLNVNYREKVNAASKGIKSVTFE
ncbi:hypothetical protein V2E24_01650 [Mycoplasmopsis ciconiae]|uniref:Lipoprotein n=1 Tax=Mycoplasmopsis ciconiae TaxID=561067 RepID=A0ABU7MLH0_9BACT|nr:hypothetical protein [Mycoplasmopsis ciconiae]